MTIVETPRDILLWGLDTGIRNLRDTIADISEEEYSWEPLSPSEQISDRLLLPVLKRVWRVFPGEDGWSYDYTVQELHPPPFTTIAWIMNHIAQTADMYLYCVKTEKAEGTERTWDDLPVPSSYAAMCKYVDGSLMAVGDYLLSMPRRRISGELNKLTPAPWGEMRPIYVNLWGGVIEHVIQHTMQIAARKDRIRYGI